MLRCHVSLYGSRKLFCKGDCSKNLIETTADRADNNKYSIESYGSWMSSGTVIVTIRQLTKSDEGQYKCGTDGVLKSLTDIVLVVKDATTTSSTQTTASVTFTETTPHVAGFFLPLVISGPVIVLLLALVLLFLYKFKSKRNLDGLNTRGNLDDRNMEICPYETYSPPYTCESSIYQSLDPASRNKDQIYSILTHSHHNTHNI
ncbi:uncharacterized protein LOC113167524 isoform X2 [Anabas testudineus]|nr:uncharacterized protein LOC113167524 isoform X2 [Anabas testudineus]